MRIVSIVGARPQFIKLSGLSRELKGVHEEFIIHTGQHYDYALSGKIFSELSIPEPAAHLGIGSGSHAAQTGEMMIAIEKKLIEYNPGLVIVFGDTNSTLAGALAASKLNLKLLHVEAGLRSFNRGMPEELNRILTDHASDILFAPTTTAMHNLSKEGLAEKSFLTGDIMVDTMKKNIEIASAKSAILETLQLKGKNFNLLTLHRNYTVDHPEILLSLLKQLDQLGEPVIFPVHPRTANVLKSMSFSTKNISFIEPLGFLDFLMLEKHSFRIITDSGGIQKEAYLLEKPCITLRTETEWIETLETGWNLLIPPFQGDISKEIKAFCPPENHPPLFGENVAKKMAQIIGKINQN